jgi:hypothetical protein
LVYPQTNYSSRISSHDLYLMLRLQRLLLIGNWWLIVYYRYSEYLYPIPLYFQVIIYDSYNAIYRHGISLASTYLCFFITSLFHRYHHASYSNFCIMYRKKRSEAVFAYISVIILLGYDQLALERDRIIHITLIRFRLILLYLFYANSFYLFLSV